MRKRAINIEKTVINEVEKILSLAKQGRKTLKSTEIMECTAIDATELWELMQTYSLQIRTKQVPIDVVRMIMLYLDAQDYRRLCLPLNKKFLTWVQQDTRAIKFSIHTTRFKKTGCSGSCYSYNACIYTDKFPITIKIGTKNTSILRKMCHHELFSREYQADFTVMISTPSGYKEVYNTNHYDWSGSSNKKLTKSDGVDLATYWMDGIGKIVGQDSALYLSHFAYALLTFYK